MVRQKVVIVLGIDLSKVFQNVFIVLGFRVCFKKLSSFEDLESNKKVDVRPPEKCISNSHSTRPVHPITTMIKWIRTSSLSMKNLSIGLNNSIGLLHQNRVEQ